MALHKNILRETDTVNFILLFALIYFELKIFKLMKKNYIDISRLSTLNHFINYNNMPTFFM